MATRKSANRKPGVSGVSTTTGAEPSAEALETLGTVLSTVSGPSTTKLDESAAASFPTEPQRRLARKNVGTQAMSAGVPFNALKASEYGLNAGHAPQEGRMSPPLAPAGYKPGQRAAGSGARRFRRPNADHESRRADLG